MAASCIGPLLLVFVVIVIAIAVKLYDRVRNLETRVDANERELNRLRERVVPEPARAQRPTATPARPELSNAAAPPEREPAAAPPPPPRPQPSSAPPPPPRAQPSAPPPPPPPPPPPAAAPASAAFDWEGLIGIKLFSWIAGVALVLAALFFLRESISRGWITPLLRFWIGIITGGALVTVCELRIARNYKTTANAMHGAAIAILFATLFAGHALWHFAFLPSPLVFALMVAVTALAVWLSIRRDSVFIALLGLVGGFATPALLATGENRPITLFSYLLLLNAGLAWVAYRKRWPHLTALSLLFTVGYQWGWTARYLGAGQLPLAAAIFAVFAVMAASSLWIGRTRDDRRQLMFDRIGVAGAVLPVIFAMFTAAVPAYGIRYNILFAFLLFLAAGLSIIATLRGPEWLHVLGGITTVLSFVLWFSRSYTERAWPALLAWVAVFVLLYLAAGYFSTRAHPFAAVLLFTIPTLLVLEPRAAAPLLPFAVLLFLLALIAAFAIILNAARTYFTAAFFALAAEAVWSGKYLSRDRLLAALTLYVVFALFFLAVPLVAQRVGRVLVPRYGTSVVMLAGIAMLFFLTGGSVANVALPGIALLLAILNAGAAWEAKRNVVVSIAAGVLSWVVLGVWWASADVVLELVPALMVVVGFAILLLVVSRESGAPLALVGHFFLFTVALDRSLSSPPGPMLTALVVLDVAIGAFALYVRRAEWWIAAMAGSQIVLFTFAATSDASFDATAIASALGIAALAFVALVLAHRRDAERDGFENATAVALFAGQLVVMVASSQSFSLQLGAHLALLLGILVLSWFSERHELAVAAVGTMAMATMFANAGDAPYGRTLFAAALYAPFIAYPLLLGARAKRALAPYLAAVLASVPFFFFAKYDIAHAHDDRFIGLLPLAQAALMLLLLVRVLRIEAPGERTLNRLAVVAAAALAFLTVAIPLQLDKQWITVGWALEGAALVWLFRRVPHRGLLAWSGALLGAAFVRLTMNPAIWLYHPPSATKIVNWYLYTYLVVAASMFVAARLLRRDERERYGWVLHAAGAVLLFFLVNIEVADFYSTGATLTFNFFSSSLAQDLTYTIAWAVFAIATLVTGIITRSHAARVSALVLLVVTILKCFLHDLARLGGLYRVGSLLGLAMSLVLVGVLLQRFVMRRTVSADEAH
jgi:uncharacterized membrane protein